MHNDPENLIAKAAYEPAAFTELYTMCADRVLSYMRYRCDDEQVAEDLTAQVFEKVLRSLHRFQDQGGRFDAWLFKIARNVVVDHYRSRRRRAWFPWEKMLNTPAEDPSIEKQVEYNQNHRAVVVAVRQLKSRERDLLGLRFGAELTNRQIAEQTGLSEQNVAVIIFRALKKIKKELSETDQPKISEVDHE